ncbi:peptidase S8/S53 domain-containing protein [Amanita rubescens]|nr:peptidase S8/S53 domain-containing protein [Amanita rubescens]
MDPGPYPSYPYPHTPAGPPYPCQSLALTPPACCHSDDVPWGVARLTSPKQLPGGTGGSTFKSFLDPNGGKGVDIYVIDSGVSIGHDDFGGRASWTNFENTNTFDGETPLVYVAYFKPSSLSNDGIFGLRRKSDFNGHGTHVAGIAAGKKYGVAKAARIIAIKVLGTAPWVYNFPAEMPNSSLIVRGMRKVSQLARAAWRDSRRHSILNLSIDMPLPNDYANYAQSLHQMIGSVTNAGVHVVIAKGNDNKNIQYTNTTDAIHVGASTIEDRRWVDSWGSSDYGRGVDLFAPGASIYSASNKDAQLSIRMSGSSMATPNVAGIIACLISADFRNRLTPREMKQKVLDLAERDGMDRMRLDERALITGTTTRLASLVLVPR